MWNDVLKLKVERLVEPIAQEAASFSLSGYGRLAPLGRKANLRASTPLMASAKMVDLSGFCAMMPAELRWKAGVRSNEPQRTSAIDEKRKPSARTEPFRL